jgi:hypothetical protein
MALVLLLSGPFLYDAPHSCVLIRAAQVLCLILPAIPRPTGRIPYNIVLSLGMHVERPSGVIRRRG